MLPTSKEKCYNHTGIKMVQERNNIHMNKNWENWKLQNKKYLLELEKFLDKADSIKDEAIKREIIMQMLKTDNELTLFAEEMFEKMYERGIQDADSKRESNG